ncbi:hypothetical protein QLX08_005152 [Tetragonisca angustula]|uniref:Uncharacterized protein n=1 Tax=Tetragonisca angustula TaxID=166442 RepID=A0AAW0ZZF4_9HYME
MYLIYTEVSRCTDLPFKFDFTRKVIFFNLLISSNTECTDSANEERVSLFWSHYATSETRNYDLCTKKAEFANFFEELGKRLLSLHAIVSFLFSITTSLYYCCFEASLQLESTV